MEVRKSTHKGMQPKCNSRERMDVVIITHNRLDLLMGAIRSVIAQSYTNFQCYVVSDYEAEWEELRDYIISLQDPRFELLENRVPGANASRNLGLRYASAEYVAFLDDDDLWEPNKLAIHLDIHRQWPGLLYSYSSVVRFYEAVSKCYEIKCPARMPVKEAALAALAPATTSCVVVKRSAALEVGGFDEALPAMQDWDLWYRLSSSCEEPEQASYWCVGFLVRYRYHRSARISGSVSKRHDAADLIRRKYAEDDEVSKLVSFWKCQAIASALWDAGFEHGGFIRLKKLISIIIENWKLCIRRPSLIARAGYYALRGSTFG